MRNIFTAASAATLATAAVALAAMLTTTAASAVPVSWTLDNWTFSDGGTASGSFVYDADLGSYSDIAVMTTAGSNLFGSFYSDLVTGDATGFELSDGFGGDLLASFTTALGNLGGMVTVVPYGEFDFLSLGLRGHGGTPSSASVIGTPQVAAVPLPATLPLLGLGLAAAALVRRRRG